MGLPVGIGLVVLGLVLGVRTLLFVRGGTATQGRVVDLSPRATQTGTGYVPVVEFTTPDGQAHRFTDEQLKSNPPRFTVGQVVAVKYDPDQPDRAKLNAPPRVWATPAFLVAMGAMTLSLELAL